MATYTPKTLVESKAFGNGAANIATWRYQATAVVGIVRTVVVVTPTAARTVTLENGSTAADTTAQKVVDAFALTANIPQVWNWWMTVTASSYFEGFANSTDINGMASGYEYA